MTKAKTNPATELSLDEQIKLFCAKGGKIQRVPEGASAKPDTSRRGVSEAHAKAALGGQRGGASKSANRQAKVLGKQTYASAMARKPKSGSQIPRSKRDE